MRIAILGWGSLLWDGGPDFDERHEQWQYDGPGLKIEFSRVSPSRQGALTLVRDEDNGPLTTVAWCLSTRRSVEGALCDLRCREGTNAKGVGCVRVSKQPDPPAPQDSIADWAREKNLDAVIWTALTSNFEKKTKTAFSVKAAIAYVKTLDACGRAKAAEYVRRAPGFVQTPLRAALLQEPWFSEAKPPV